MLLGFLYRNLEYLSVSNTDDFTMLFLLQPSSGGCFYHFLLPLVIGPDNSITHFVLVAFFFFFGTVIILFYFIFVYCREAHPFFSVYFR
jgi:hypothetical protein